MAILYLMPLPEDLNLHFGIDISFKSISNRERFIRIIGYDERRYYQRVWHSSRSSSVEMKMTESFSYCETFRDIEDNEDIAQVDVWTIVDGQMIAKTSGTVHDSPNSVPKPPRIHSVQQEEPFVKIRDPVARLDSGCGCQGEESCDKSNCQRQQPDDVILTGSESSMSRGSSVGSKNVQFSSSSPAKDELRAKSLTNILDEVQTDVPMISKMKKKSVSQGNKLQQVNNSFNTKKKRSVSREREEKVKEGGYNNYAFEEEFEAETRGDRHILI